MKIVFLDIDGVVNTESDLSRGILINSELVLRIDKLCRDNNSKIVISSSWRNSYTLDNLRMLFKVCGMFTSYSTIIDKTSCNITRGEEIKKWLDSRGDIDGYVIIDDYDDFYDFQKPFWVQTSFKLGFSEDKFKEACDVLSMQLKRNFS